MSRKNISKSRAKSTIKPVETQVSPTEKSLPGNPSFYSVKFKVIFVVVILLIFGLLFVFRSLIIAASVNGQPITRLAVVRELEKKGGKQVMDSIISQTLILQEAKKQNISVSDADTQAEIKKIEDSLKKQGQKLDDVLQMQGMSKADFVQEVKMQKIIEKMLSSKVKVTDAEVKDYMEKNKSTIPEGTKPEDVKKQIEQQKLRTEFQTWLQDLRKKAKISTFVNY